MARVDDRRINDIFAYLSGQRLPPSMADCAFVFGRADPLVAARTAELFHQRLVRAVMISGGIGKDSGFLVDAKLPEACWLAAVLTHDTAVMAAHGVPTIVRETALSAVPLPVPATSVLVEDRAGNGGENCRFGIAALRAAHWPMGSLCVVGHATSLRRFAATLELELRNVGIDTQLSWAATRYAFDPHSPRDQREAVDELLRLADWPAKGWCAAQDDLPQDLVEYARSVRALLG